MSDKLLSLAREVGADDLLERLDQIARECDHYEYGLPLDASSPARPEMELMRIAVASFVERIRQEEREKALSLESISEAVRAYVQAGKRGEDLLGAMRCAIEAAIRSSGTSGRKSDE